MPAHLIQAMPMLVLGLGALAGIAVTWLRGRRAGGQRAAAARRDLAVGLASAACWAANWVLYATYTWTAVPRLSTLQAARFYVPALGAISLLGAWLLVRAPGGHRGGLAGRLGTELRVWLVTMSTREAREKRPRR